MRKLDPDEQALWQRVAETIRPIKPVAEGAPLPLPVNNRVTRIFRHEPRPASTRALTLGDNLDSSWEKKFRSGGLEPERTLDLHGMNLDTAWVAVDRLLDRAWHNHERVVLLVTGKERAEPERTGRGRIRAALRDWLAHSRHAPHIAAVRGAHRRHGGAGSVYVIMRRR
ncbi:MAG: Smr/MutS family protein [Sphingomicrobium sp.]